MSAHTPGPWTAGDKSHVVDLDGWHVNCFPVSGQGLAIAGVWGGDSRRRLALMLDTGRANARLIAAAPVMYDALRECEQLLKNPDAEPDDADRVLDVITTVLATIREGAP
jgi:hypothetical protein